MLWIGLSLITALAVAARDVSVKSYTDLHSQDIAAIELFWAMPLLAAGLLVTPIPLLDGTFWWTFLVSIPLNLLAYILYLKAIKLSPLSLTVPFLSFTPVFMILTGYVTLGETISIWGGIGIIWIILGSYLLNFNEAEHGLLRPFSALMREPGAALMLAVAFIYAFAAVLGKKAIIHSSPLFFAFFFFLAFNGITVFLLLISGRFPIKGLLRERRRGSWLGILLTAHVASHGLAIAVSTAVYMVAVKRSSILFTVLFSWLILKEKNMRYRGFGAICMFAGVLMITFLG